MIVEKTYKCCSYYKGVDDLVLEAAEDIKKGYHVVQVEKEDMNFSGSLRLLEPNLIVTLRKEI